MPQVLERDPAWLAAPAPAAKLFKPDSEAKQPLTQDVSYDAPLRKVAYRGTEIFVVAGNELRWSDLGMLKDAGEDMDRRYGGGSAFDYEDGGRAYRVST
jgi:nucleoporin NUP82